MTVEATLRNPQYKASLQAIIVEWLAECSHCFTGGDTLSKTVLVRSLKYRLHTLHGYFQTLVGVMSSLRIRRSAAGNVSDSRAFGVISKISHSKLLVKFKYFLILYAYRGV